MKHVLLRAIALSVFVWPCQAWSCDGSAGRSVATTYDGQKITVTNIGRQYLTVAFTAYGNSYNLQLAPGQSDSPRSPGMFGQFMAGYQSCTATPVAYR